AYMICSWSLREAAALSSILTGGNLHPKTLFPPAAAARMAAAARIRWAPGVLMLQAVVPVCLPAEQPRLRVARIPRAVAAVPRLRGVWQPLDLGGPTLVAKTLSRKQPMVVHAPRDRVGVAAARVAGYCLVLQRSV